MNLETFSSSCPERQHPKARSPSTSRASSLQRPLEHQVDSEAEVVALEDVEEEEHQEEAAVASVEVGEADSAEVVEVAEAATLVELMASDSQRI